MRILFVMLAIVAIEGFSAPMSNIAVCSTPRTSSLVAKFPWSRKRTSSPSSAPFDADDEEVCYLKTEKQGVITYDCGPLVEATYPDWWKEFDWPAGSQQAITVAGMKA